MYNQPILVVLSKLACAWEFKSSVFDIVHTVTCQHSLSKLSFNYHAYPTPMLKNKYSLRCETLWNKSQLLSFQGTLFFLVAQFQFSLNKTTSTVQIGPTPVAAMLSFIIDEKNCVQGLEVI